jgi:hypothetical protein
MWQKPKDVFHSIKKGGQTGSTNSSFKKIIGRSIMAKLYDLKKMRKAINELDKKRLHPEDQEDEGTKDKIDEEPGVDDVIKELEEGILQVCEDKDRMSDKLLDLNMRREAVRILLESYDEEISEVKDKIIEIEILRREMTKDLEEARKAAKALMLPNSIRVTA